MQVFFPLFFPEKYDYKAAYVRGDTLPPVSATFSNNQSVSIKFDRKWKSKNYYSVFEDRYQSRDVKFDQYPHGEKS